MCRRSSTLRTHRPSRVLTYLATIAVSLGLAGVTEAQTASTGALIGIALDASGAALQQVTICLNRHDGAESRSVRSDEEGRFVFLLLSPGLYTLEASKTQFRTLTLQDVRIHAAETLQINLKFELEVRQESVQVSAQPVRVQLDAPTVGRTVEGDVVHRLPLVTRNFSQLSGLSPGISAGVYNAGELGNGGTALSQIGPSNDGIYVHGGRSYDSNWQLNGVSVSDVMGTSTASGGIPIPNPDTIEEFKVQTGLYSAAFGRAAGANVSVITKMGGNSYHGSVFEFLRNDALNANEYFLKQAGRQRPVLKQNQFGFVFGGPIERDKLFFFGSYQGTRQTNGVAAGQARVACTARLYEPPLTNDRSPAALGALFGGMQGALGGVAVNPDGSNINPVALKLLNLKLPDGTFLIPTPQTVDRSRPFATEGFSAFSDPCHFSEDQLLLNLDYVATQRNHLAARLFRSNMDQLVTFPGNGTNMGNISGFGNAGTTDFSVASLAYTRVVSAATLNQAQFGYVGTRGRAKAKAPFAWSDIGVAESAMNGADQLPSLLISGSVSMASAFPRTYTQCSWVLSDVLSTQKSRHSLQFGGSITRLQDPLEFAGVGSFVQFLSWPDFLLGLNSSENGTQFSNVFQSSDAFGLLDREFRAWEGSAFLQDDVHVSRVLNVNLGMRFEHVGQFGDNLGRNSSFDVTRANPDPPPGGSLNGYIVASTFPGALPPGVIRANNTSGTYSNGQNVVAPRIGVAWQLLPHTSRLVLRAGYGIYHSRPTGQAFTASVLAPPFGLRRILTGVSNAGATSQTPFAQPFPSGASFPIFVPYSATTQVSANVLAADFRPAAIQQFGLNVQSELEKDLLLEVGYVGSRGAHLQRFRSLNQALDASPANPIRGQTSNTLANIGLRVSVPGIVPDALRAVESAGNSWYNGLETSVTKWWSHGLQFLASYTFSKTLDTDAAAVDGTSAANTLTRGDQNTPVRRRGRASFDRTQRFVFSGTWLVPGPSSGWKRSILSAWSLAAVVTVQSGVALTVVDTNANNVFGISEDVASLSGRCTKDQLVTPGPVPTKLKTYFNATCFISPAVIGADGKGRAFGNSGAGIVNGPGQANVDVALSKLVAIHWPMEKGNLEFRAEFYNAINHPQFDVPNTDYSSPMFGVISNTAVNARMGQLAVRYSF